MLVVLATLIALALVAARVYIGMLAEPPLSLPAAGAEAAGGTLDGTWEVAAGSVAGFRIEQTVMFMSGDAVGRTSHVTGTLLMAGDQITSATIRIDLTTVTSAGKPQPQFALSLDTKHDPTATFTLTEPVTLPASFVTGATVTTNVTGQLTMHGQTRNVRVGVSARRDGPAIEVLGSIPIDLSDWAIEGPNGYGPLASVADHGTAELLLLVRHQ